MKVFCWLQAASLGVPCHLRSQSMTSKHMTCLKLLAATSGGYQLKVVCRMGRRPPTQLYMYCAISLGLSPLMHDIPLVITFNLQSQTIAFEWL